MIRSTINLSQPLTPFLVDFDVGIRLFLTDFFNDSTPNSERDSTPVSETENNFHGRRDPVQSRHDCNIF